MDDAAKRCRNAASGRRSRVAGAHWEQIIEATLRYYSDVGRAEIAKTPEPMRPLSGPNAKGQFLACFTKRAQPDYKGTLYGGNAVVFEAKHTDTGRMRREAVTAEQGRQLDRHQDLGATCFVMLSFSFQRFFRVPWGVFRDMKRLYGRNYVTPEDLRMYEVKYRGGVLRFL